MKGNMKIAVLGAGYVGTAFAAAALASRTASGVWAVRRTPPTFANGDELQWLRGDIGLGEVVGLPAQLDAVVLTVAPSGGSDAYESVYPPAAKAAVRIARETGAHSLLYTSSTGVYGGRDGVVVTEQSGRQGGGTTNAALIAAEDIVLASDSARPTVFRVAGIYGPGRDPRDRFRQPDRLAMRGEYWVNLAHRDDIVSAILHTLSVPAPPRILNVSDGAPTRASDIARWLAVDAGADAHGLRFGNDAAPARNDQRVSCDALKATGWAPRYASFREGFSRGL
jgi:nucleoside-diphosphate-sugar epimerase